MTLALSHPMTIKPEDFDPPLKRKDAAVPYYWTVDELAEELGVSARKVQMDITGYEKLKVQAKLKAIKAGSFFLIAEQDAFEYIRQQRKLKSRS
ncbi:DNA-binding protein [Aphanothece hegewaldii CCALA 016]|uniref:DNA-binding protein n=1 Tax=Aphanothece hegewaldii CCALA 016 TaxID=2107694 RepID=A0A2T1LQJ6_9CHRO|nr:helix-turn-helix domain-containing protein [Aphanothece hegewaldii]PSF28490.1 DNA-binding protein [Aphanothece hegewaldii CCALA 016]